MSYRLVFSNQAKKVLRRLDRDLQRRIAERVEQLAVDPRDAGVSKAMTGRPGLRSSRVGGWRILFTVDQTEAVVHISMIDRRGQVYKHM